MRARFWHEVATRLYPISDAEELSKDIEVQMRHLESQLEKMGAVVPMLEANLLHIACDDPSAALANDVFLPLLRSRVDAETEKYAQRMAHELEMELVRSLRPRSIPKLQGCSAWQPDALTQMEFICFSSIALFTRFSPRNITLVISGCVVALPTRLRDVTPFRLRPSGAKLSLPPLIGSAS